MLQSTATEGSTSPAERDADEPGGSDTPGHIGHQPELDPREEALLGLLLRLPATWIR